MPFLLKKSSRSRSRSRSMSRSITLKKEVESQDEWLNRASKAETTKLAQQSLAQQSLAQQSLAPLAPLAPELLSRQANLPGNYTARFPNLNTTGLDRLYKLNPLKSILNINDDDDSHVFDRELEVFGFHLERFFYSEGKQFEIKRHKELRCERETINSFSVYFVNNMMNYRRSFVNNGTISLLNISITLTSQVLMNHYRNGFLKYYKINNPNIKNILENNVINHTGRSVYLLILNLYIHIRNFRIRKNDGMHTHYFTSKQTARNLEKMNTLLGNLCHTVYDNSFKEFANITNDYDLKEIIDCLIEQFPKFTKWYKKERHDECSEVARFFYDGFTKLKKYINK